MTSKKKRSNERRQGRVIDITDTAVWWEDPDPGVSFDSIPGERRHEIANWWQRFSAIMKDRMPRIRERVADGQGPDWPEFPSDLREIAPASNQEFH